MQEARGLGCSARCGEGLDLEGQDLEGQAAIGKSPSGVVNRVASKRGAEGGRIQ